MASTKNASSQVLMVSCLMVAVLVGLAQVGVTESQWPRRHRLPDVDVVIAGDRAQAVGIIASARSVFAATADPDRIRLHVMTDAGSVETVGEAIRCALSNRHVDVHVFDLQNYTTEKNGTSRFHVRVPIKKHKVSLASDLNFARFYLAEVLGPRVAKVVYLDADTIAVGDVAALYDRSLASHASENFVFAAVSRQSKKICGAFLNCGLFEVDSLLRSHGIFDPEADLDAFNAGVMVIDVHRWTRQKFTEQIEYWIRWNDKLPLYDLASNPPLVLAARGNFEHLDESWNCQRVMPCWNAGNASVLHWNGINKPWHLRTDHDKTYWLGALWGDATAAHPCMAALPEVGKPPDDVGSDSQARRQYSADVKQSAMAAWIAQSLNQSWHDLDLLDRAAAVIAAGGPRAVDVGNVYSAMRESLGAYDKISPGRLVASIAGYLRAIDLPHRCDFLVVAYLGGKLHADTSNFGPGATCGASPPETVVTFLYFFAAVTHDAAPLVDDVVFVVATSVGTSKTSPRVPAFVLAKKKGKHQPGILVPGPAFVSQAYDRRADHDPMATRSVSSSPTVYSEFAAAAHAAWVRRHAALDATAAASLANRANVTDDVDVALFKAPPWNERSTRATWRGRTNSRYFSCLDDATWARLEVLAAGQVLPRYLETHLTTAKEEPEDVELCVARANLSPDVAKRMTKMLRKGLMPSRPSSGVLREFATSKYVIILPETKSRFDSHAASVWGVGAAVLRWDSNADRRSPRWISPALENGATHVTVNVATVAKVVAMLRDRDDVARRLAENARRLHTDLLCPTCIRDFWAATLRDYAAHFHFAATTTSQLRTVLQSHGFVLSPIEDVASWFIGRFTQTK